MIVDLHVSFLDSQKWCGRAAAQRVALAVAIACLVCLPLRARADDDLDSLEQKAINAAVQHVAPSVVSIETIGGSERVIGKEGADTQQGPKKVLYGEGPTTGLVIDRDGYILSSAFNFANKPASILVHLPDGTQKAAKLVATDHSHMIVLLKVKPDRPLPEPEIAPEADLRIGQWCIGVGRAFEVQRPNITVGVLSATGRIAGKAVQTDALVSPNNFGGPLVDIRGRAIGVIVPLSPQSREEIGGEDWYDSGIGFAVLVEHLRDGLAKLKQGKDLYPGVAGIGLKSADPYASDTTIANCAPKSPADKAKIKAGDHLVELAGKKILRPIDIDLSRHYAGDKISFAVLRGDKRIEGELVLVRAEDIQPPPAPPQPKPMSAGDLLKTFKGPQKGQTHPKKPAAKGVEPAKKSPEKDDAQPKKSSEK